MIPDCEHSGAGRGWRRGLLIGLIATPVLAPYLLLVVLSMGSGWTFPNLLPDRVDGGPVHRMMSERDGLLRAIGVSLVLSLCVGLVSTAGGLLIGRSVRRSPSRVVRFLMYLPFVISPVVIGICLYDLLVRLQLSGTYVGVGLSQSIVAMSFAAVFFSETWSAPLARRELLVRQLGGGAVDVWRHAVLPQISPLIVICFLQSALYSWLDFGLVSIVGGGQAPTVTTRVFALIREASVNQAALSSLILLAPPLCVALLCGSLVQRRRVSRRPVEREIAGEAQDSRG